MPSVLLVEPDADSRDMYAEFLGQSGIRSVVVDSAADALAHARKVDAIVTGIRLHGDVDGLTLINWLRQDPRTRSTPIVVVSACAWQNERDLAMQAGCDLFLAKPCLPSELLAELRRLFASAKVKRVRGKTALARADFPPDRLSKDLPGQKRKEKK